MNKPAGLTKGEIRKAINAFAGKHGFNCSTVRRSTALRQRAIDDYIKRQAK